MGNTHCGFVSKQSMQKHSKLVHNQVNNISLSKTILIFYSKAYFNRDLKVGDFAIYNVAARFNDFKPVQVL